MIALHINGFLSQIPRLAPRHGAGLEYDELSTVLVLFVSCGLISMMPSKVHLKVMLAVQL